MACGHRAPSGRGGASINFSLLVYTADANDGLRIGRSCVDALGAVAGYVPGHCLPLPLLSKLYNKGVNVVPFGGILYF